LIHMSEAIEQAVVRILSPTGATVGTGFALYKHVIVTCAHVLEAAQIRPGQTVHFSTFRGGIAGQGQVAVTGWSPRQADDVAFILGTADWPLTALPVMRAVLSQGQQYRSLGFARLAGYEARWASDEIAGIVPAPNKQPMLQLKGQEIKGGMSGSPVLALTSARVVGMISEYQDDDRTRFAWATTIDTIMMLAPHEEVPDLFVSAQPAVVHTRKKRVHLRNTLRSLFNTSELRGLCFDLDIEYEDLQGDTRNEKAQSLVEYCERHNRSAELMEKVRLIRPDAQV
jgi:hypothetical protein